MAETIEEIAALIKSLKLDNELSNEDLNKVLTDIKNRVAELHDYNEAAAVAAAIQQTIDSKSLVDTEKMRELDETLRQLRIKVDSSADIAELTEQVKLLADNFKSGFNSVVSFANKDADAKNLLLDRMEDLEKAVKNGAMIETLRQRTDDLVKGYENFISDSNLRHGNMVSALVDLKNKIDDYSSKNNYVFGAIDHTITDTSDKLTNLENTVSSNLGNVNSKLYSMGDDIQKILNDGFDHLKYLSSNMSEAMNSSSLDVKTTLEVLKANLSDFSEHLKDEFGALNKDLVEKIESGANVSSVINNDILNNVKEVADLISAKSNDYEGSLSEKVQGIQDFIQALQETVNVLKTENTALLTEKLSGLSSELQSINSNYEQLISGATEEIRKVSETVEKTSDDIVQKLKETDIQEVYDVKNELLASSSSNLNAIIEKIQGVSESVDSFKESTGHSLANYLTSIKDLFTEFSSRVEVSQSNSEVLEKLSNLEILMSRFDIEKNDNFAQLQNLIQKNADAINELGGIRNVIEEHSSVKDEKLADIENLINKFDDEKNRNFEQLKDMLGKNTEAIEALNVKTGSDMGLEKIENLIRENSASKDEKLSNLEVLMSRFDLEKNENFAQLQSLLNKNAETLDAIKLSGGSAGDIERLTSVIGELDNARDEKLENLKNLVAEYKDTVGKLSENIQAQSEKELSEISELKMIANDVLPKQSALNELSDLINGKVFECKDKLSEEINAVKDSIESINNGLKNISPAYDDTSVSLKLAELSNQLSESSQGYEHALSVLSSRLEDYVEATENISMKTGAKIEASSDEFTNIQARFDEMASKMDNLVGESGLIEILANIRQQFGVISEQLVNEKEGIISGVETSLTDNVNSISTALIQLRQGLEDVHEKQLENFGGLIFNLEAIRTDINAVMSGVERAVSEKVTSVTEEFKPLQDAIKEFNEVNYEQVISDVKQQIELSYVALTKELEGKISGNSDFVRVEEAYKFSAERLTSLEELVRNSVNDNIDSIKNTLFNVHNLTQSNLTILEDLQSAFQADLISLGNKVTESHNSLSSSILQELSSLRDAINSNKAVDAEELRSAVLPMLENEDLVDTIRSLNKSLADKITEFKQDNDLEAQDILDVVNSVKNTTEYILEVINDKFEKSDSNASKILENIDALNAKLDVIVMAIDNNEVINAVSEINNKFANLEQGFEGAAEKTNSQELKAILAKLDALASVAEENEHSLDFEELKNGLTELAKQTKTVLQYEKLINILNEKLDVIAMADNSDNIDAGFDELKAAIDDLSDNLKMSYNPESILGRIEKKIDLISQSGDMEISESIGVIREDLYVLKSDLTSTETKLENYLRAMDSTLDVLTSAHEDNQRISNNIEDVKDDISLLSNNIRTLDNKLDIIAQSDNEEVLAEIDDLRSTLDSSVSRFTKFADDTDENINKKIEELKEQLSSTESTLEDYSRTLDYKLDEISQFSSVHEKLENIKSDVQESLKLEDLINKLNKKVDILAMSDDSDVIDEIYGIKSLVEEQLAQLHSSVEDDGQVQKLMEGLSRIDNSIAGLDFSQQASDIKESVISALVSVTNEISFVEEADEIKDYVGEKTNELHRLLMDVKHQLYTITNSSDDMDMYTYTLQDVESDLAKLRLALNDFADKKSDNELVVISNNLNKMSRAMTDLREAVVDAEIKRTAANGIDEVNEQVVSISSRLNKLLLAKRESDSQIIDKLDMNLSAISGMDTKRFSDRVEKALVETDKKLEYTANIITVLKNVMIYLGEWMDGTTETLSSIYDKTSFSEELSSLKEFVSEKLNLSDFEDNVYMQLKNIEAVGQNFVEQGEFMKQQISKFNQLEADIENLQNIVENTISQNELKADELQNIVEKAIAVQEQNVSDFKKDVVMAISQNELKIEELHTDIENRILKQDTRLDRIEKALDRIASVLESSSSNGDTIEKIEELDEKVTKLSSNIEKLAAYVE